MNNQLVLSQLEHTWILDLDGTILKHNGYLIDGQDALLPGAREFLDSIPQNDFVLFLTSRKSKYKIITEEFLEKNGVRYNQIIFDIPYGERILVNDDKPSGLCMAYAVQNKRDCCLFPQIDINEEL